MAEHSWGWFDYCAKCGVGRAEVLDNVRSTECPGADNVVAISETLSTRWYNRTIAPVTGHRLKE